MLTAQSVQICLHFYAFFRIDIFNSPIIRKFLQIAFRNSHYLSNFTLDFLFSHKFHNGALFWHINCYIICQEFISSNQDKLSGKRGKKMANNNWKITCLHYGTLSCYKSLFDGGLDQVRYPFVYCGYLLQKDGRNILVDTGVHQDNIIDGKAWANSPAEGGNQYVLNALKGEGLTPDDIEIVMYTHLHNDHAGGVLLFPNAQHLFQRDEYFNMLHPLPSQKIRRDYDPRTPGDIAQIKNIRMIDGDFDMGNGIRLYKVPGHTLGGMAIQVQTVEGRYVITGDMPHIRQSLFPQMDKMEIIGGDIVDITPAPESWGPFILNSVIYDHYACYDSFNKVMLLAEREQPKWFLTGHDMAVVNTKYFGWDGKRD